MNYNTQDELKETRVQVIDRLTLELYNTEDKVEALDKLLSSDEILIFSDNEYILLDSALKCLKAYEFVLSDKIDKLKEEEDDIIYLGNIKEVN